MKNRLFYFSCLFGGILLCNCLSLNGQKIIFNDFHFLSKSTSYSKKSSNSSHFILKEHSIKEPACFLKSSSGLYLMNGVNFPTDFVQSAGYKTIESSFTKNTLERSKKGIFHSATAYNQKRFLGVLGISNAAYISTMVGVSKLWYSQFDKTSFHFIKDGKNWKQMDKMGHTWTAYTETVLLQDLYEWTGLNKKKATILAAISATIYQGSIEILDGQSAAWGASWGDLAANTIGVGMAAGQNLIWNEQKILIKYSAHKIDYNNLPDELRTRAEDLYGNSFAERMLKDYNGQTYWLSFNPFEQSTKWPAWLNLAVGTGIDQVYGATSNVWVKDDFTYDYSHILPRREFYLALDINLTKIQTPYAWLNFILHSLNSIKIPSPTLVFSNNKWQAKAFYF